MTEYDRNSRKISPSDTGKVFLCQVGTKKYKVSLQRVHSLFKNCGLFTHPYGTTLLISALSKMSPNFQTISMLS